ncbi:MAG: DUF1963 domain-containing protein [Chitinophagaceae bacterium]
MGLFDFLKRKPAPQAPAPQKSAVSGNVPDMTPVELEPGLTVPAVLLDVFRKAKEMSVPYVKITAQQQDDISLHQSSFGNYPCIPAGFDYPKDSEGKFMYPLAQLNCRDLPALPGYPASGYLQFYVSTNDVYGLNFDNLREQKDFRVHYFTEEEVKEYQTDFSFLQQVIIFNESPVYGPHALSFESGTDHGSMLDYRFIKQVQPMIDQLVQKYPAYDDELNEYMYDTLSGSDHKAGGYAYFTQEDPRTDNPEMEDYILLLQIDSDDHIMWGDAGVANFFIHPDDLARLDFSRVMYTWDCS